MFGDEAFFHNAPALWACFIRSHSACHCKSSRQQKTAKKSPACDAGLITCSSEFVLLAVAALVLLVALLLGSLVSVGGVDAEAGQNVRGEIDLGRLLLPARIRVCEAHPDRAWRGRCCCLLYAECANISNFRVRTTGSLPVIGIWSLSTIGISLSPPTRSFAEQSAH